MNFLIIAGPYEADLLRRAALAASCEALAIEAGDSLSGWVAAARPNLIIAAGDLLGASPADFAARVRGLPGGDVPIVFLCDEPALADATTAGAAAILRPAPPEQVIAIACRVVETGAPGFPASPPAVGGDEASAPGPGPAASSAPGAPPAAFSPLLAPPRRRTGSARPAGSTAIGAPARPFMSQLAASIDVAVDAEMAAMLRGVGTAAAVQRPAFAQNDQQTLEVPRELFNTILSDANPLRQGSHPATTSTARGPLPRLPLVGDLAEVDLASLLGAAMWDGLTGRLRVRQNETEKSIFFEAGRPVLAVSNAAEDRMVLMLLRDGVLSSSQCDRAIEVATQSSRRMGAVLVELGFIKSNELLVFVRQHYEEIVVSLFAWKSGQFRFEPGATADPRRVRLLQHPCVLVQSGLERGYDEARLRQVVAGKDRIYRLNPRANTADVLLEISGDDSNLGRLPVLFDGFRTIAEIMRMSGQPEATVNQFVVVLRAFGLLSEVQTITPRRPELNPAALRDMAVDRERIGVRMKLVREGSYFDVLGLSPDVGVDEVRKAHDRIANELSEDAIGEQLARECARELAEIETVLREALVILASDESRARYRAAIS